VQLVKEAFECALLDERACRDDCGCKEPVPINAGHTATDKCMCPLQFFGAFQRSV